MARRWHTPHRWGTNRRLLQAQSAPRFRGPRPGTGTTPSPALVPGSRACPLPAICSGRRGAEGGDTNGQSQTRPELLPRGRGAGKPPARWSHATPGLGFPVNSLPTRSRMDANCRPSRCDTPARARPHAQRGWAAASSPGKPRPRASHPSRTLSTALGKNPRSRWRRGGGLSGRCPHSRLPPSTDSRRVPWYWGRGGHWGETVMHKRRQRLSSAVTATHGGPIDQHSALTGLEARGPSSGCRLGAWVGAWGVGTRLPTLLTEGLLPRPLTVESSSRGHGSYRGDPTPATVSPPRFPTSHMTRGGGANVQPAAET